MLLIITCYCVAVARYLFPWIKTPENLCGTSIYMPPSHQKLFLQGVNITYLRPNHAIVTITLFIFFIFNFWHESHGRIWVYSNPYIFEVFTNCFLCWPKRVKQMHKIDLPGITYRIYLFHNSLQCLILVVHAAVDDTIEDKNETIFLIFHQQESLSLHHPKSLLYVQ